MAFTKEVKPTDSFLVHLFGALLCEDGSYLLNEDLSRINLEWFSTKVVKPVTIWTT